MRIKTGIAAAGVLAAAVTGVTAQPAQALNHVYSSCWATRYEANTVDYGASGTAVNNWFDCGGTTTSQGSGTKSVSWDTDYYAPNEGYVQVVFSNVGWADGNWHAIAISLCKLGGGGCLFKKTAADRPW